MPLFLCRSNAILVTALIWVQLIGFTKPAQAYTRAWQSIGQKIDRAGLIVLGDTGYVGAPDYKITLTVREVIQAKAETDRVEVGDRIDFTMQGNAHWLVPRSAQGIVVMLGPNWRKNPIDVVEVYQTASDIETLRQLLPIYGLATERQRLLALQEKITDLNPAFGDQLLQEFRTMKDRENFDLLLSSFEHLDDSHRAALLTQLGVIGDVRGLPLLIDSMSAPGEKTRRAAAQALSLTFPGAVGVDRAFLERLKDPDDRLWVRYYVETRHPDLVAELHLPAYSLWSQAHQFLREGKKQEARAALFSVLDAESRTRRTASYTRIFQLLREGKYEEYSKASALRTKENETHGHVVQALDFLPILSAPEKVHLRSMLVQYIGQDLDDSYEATEAIALLRSLPNVQNAAPLLKLLLNPDPNQTVLAWADASRAATFALYEMGPDARRQGATKVLQRIQQLSAPNAPLRFQEDIVLLCQLAWLADSATWQKALKELPESWQESMKPLQPLNDAAVSKHEAQALTAALLEPDVKGVYRWQGDAKKWIVARLGELRDPVAVDALLAELKRYPGNGIDYAVVNALQAIGGKNVEAGALVALSDKQAGVRRVAVSLLATLQGEKMRPLLRRMLMEPFNADQPWGDRQEAIMVLARVGTPEDLPLLLPYTDFWDKSMFDQNARYSIAEIRRRFNYDVNGPIPAEKI